MKKLAALLAALLFAGSAAAQVPGPSTFTITTPTVTSTSAQVLAANYTRRHLSIQNNDAAGIIYCSVTTTAVTATTGVKINIGQMWSPTPVPSNVVTCIGSIASNANVIVIEGN